MSAPFEPTEPHEPDERAAWLAPIDAPPTPPEAIDEDDGPRKVWRVLGWVRLAFVAGSAVVLLMFMALVLVLTHATTTTPIPAPAPVPVIRVLPVTEADWPGYAPDAPLTGGAPSRGALATYATIAARLAGVPNATPLGYTVWAAIDPDGTLDFDRDPHGSVGFDFALGPDLAGDEQCIQVTLARGYPEQPVAIACDTGPLPFAPPDLGRVLTLARITCPVLFDHGARPRVTARPAERWHWIEVVDPSLPDLAFRAVAARDGTLGGERCETSPAP